MNEPESSQDWEDRLVDVALNEAIGGETPPDLSEKILATSIDESEGSVLPGDQTMNDAQHVQISRRKQWTMLAVSACLLLAVGMLTFSTVLNPLRMAKVDVSAMQEKVAKEIPARQFDVDGEPVPALSDSLDTLSESEVLSAELETGATDLSPADAPPIVYPDEETWRELKNRRRKYSKPDSEPQPTDELMMGVTPHIIIAEGEEERLGIEVGQPAPSATADSGDRSQLSAGTVDQKTGNVDLDNSMDLIRSTVVVDSWHEATEAPASGRGQAAAEPTDAPAPATEVDGYLVEAGRESADLAKQPAELDIEERYSKAAEEVALAQVPEDSESKSSSRSLEDLEDQVVLNQQWFYPEENKRKSKDRELKPEAPVYSFNMGFNRGKSESVAASGSQSTVDRLDRDGVEAGRGGKPALADKEKPSELAVKVYPVEDLVVPLTVEGTSDIGSGDNQAAGLADGRARQPQAAAENEVVGREKNDPARSSAEAKESSTGTNFDVADISGETREQSFNADSKRMILQQLKAKKQALVDLEVMKAVSKDQAESPIRLEAVVQSELLADPKFQSFQNEQFAYTQQLTQLKAATKNSDSPDIKRLQEQLRSVEHQHQEYRKKKESEIRDRLKHAPAAELSAVMTEYMLRKQAIAQEVAELEAQLRGESPARAARGAVANQLNEKITEYQRVASRGFGRDRARYDDQLSTLNSEIQTLRRIKRRLDAQSGVGPGLSGDQYSRIYENPFVKTKRGENNYSTFSIDVDTASYANVRQFLMQSHQLPPPDAVRLEELINYFDYDYSGPTGDVPFAAHVEVAGCPWNAEHRLVRIGIKGHEIDRQERPQSNLVFLIDVSGSMNEPAKLPLLVEGMKMLTRELGENDKVAIVVYASSEGMALPSTRGDKQQVILSALNKLRAGGSTAGGAGIKLAYKTAIENYIEGGVNRVILCTDGDFNVGVTSTAELERMAEKNAEESGVFLTVLGFGRGNLNDSMMEAISGKGNGNYHYVDGQTEARKVLVEEMAGTLVTIAKDVKIQVDFNPYQVAGYRLLGYENRILRAEDFKNDKIDAGEIGAGHTVTALYEIVPAGQSVDVPQVDPSKYIQPKQEPETDEGSDELFTLNIRYKAPDGDKSKPLSFPIKDEGQSFSEATPDFQFASAVASFGMLLRDSEHKGNASLAAVAEIAENGAKRDPHEYRAEFLQMVKQARQLSGE